MLTINYGCYPSCNYVHIFHGSNPEEISWMLTDSMDLRHTISVETPQKLKHIFDIGRLPQPETRASPQSPPVVKNHGSGQLKAPWCPVAQWLTLRGNILEQMISLRDSEKYSGYDRLYKVVPQIVSVQLGFT